MGITNQMQLPTEKPFVFSGTVAMEGSPLHLAAPPGSRTFTHRQGQRVDDEYLSLSQQLTQEDRYLPERLQQLVAISSIEGVRVGLLTETGRMTEDPDTAVVLCNSVKGLGLTLDPSHYIFGPHQGKPFDQVMEHVYHVRLRDTSKAQLQVRVGQGEVDYGRLVTQLRKAGYNRALSVDLIPMPGVDQPAEMRKMRLLLESLL